MKIAALLVHNEGATDRIVRIVVGVVLLSLVFIGPKTPWGLLGLIPLVTGSTGVCPMYSILGMNTHRKPNA